MEQDDPLFFWLLAPELSVVDAAILIAGGDPSAVDYEATGPYFDSEQTTVKRTTRHNGYTPVFASLRVAIRRGELSARIAYRARRRDQFSQTFSEDFFVVTSADLEMAFGMHEGGFPKTGEKFEIQDEPDWSETTIDVPDLRRWLASRGLTRGFFFEQSAPEPDDFTDPSHDHFSPELDLAVAAWRGLSKTRSFKISPKAAIKEWIEGNPSAWRGDDTLSGEAKEKIAGVVNWKKSGGAPRTGG